jgi:hypothetical protein
MLNVQKSPKKMRKARAHKGRRASGAGGDDDDDDDM